jgi:hypothetical protein
LSIINRYDPLLKGRLIGLVSLMDASKAAATHSIHSPLPQFFLSSGRLLLKVSVSFNRSPAQYLVVGFCIWLAKNQFITLNTAVKRIPAKSGDIKNCPGVLSVCLTPPVQRQDTHPLGSVFCHLKQRKDFLTLILKNVFFS